ncbi:flotillin-1-like [Dendronephthya gigantea]|uniref:flotillin-1-like n=1 Tax=Dendronephthya gigantea TaxID=151771 RepID=UPI00106B05BD|nr:flotillin-1-like [Dendronephthya gigantea]
MPLNIFTLNIQSPKAYTHHGVPIIVSGVAQVKINSQKEEMLRQACELFMGKKAAEIRGIALETMEGHQRAILARMTVEEIYRDRKKFAESVFQVASADLINMGISVISYTLKDIRDDEGYLKALGKSRTAEVKKDARVGEAEASRDSGIKTSLADLARLEAKYENDTEIARQSRDFKVKDETYRREIKTKVATAELAYDLQVAITKQTIKEEEMGIKIAERAQEIKVQQEEISRREKVLEANVKLPVDASKYEMEKMAEANLRRVTLEAEAKAETIRLKNEALAYVIEAKGTAEAENMVKKADAWKQYEDAAIVDMFLETLPKVVAEVSAPVTSCDKITMVSIGDGPIGIQKMTREILGAVRDLPTEMHDLTGIDITKVTNDLVLSNK